MTIPRKNLFRFIALLFIKYSLFFLHCFKVLMNPLTCYQSTTISTHQSTRATKMSIQQVNSFRDESVPFMKLTVRIISKVFLDGRQVLFYVSVNISKSSRKGEKEGIYVQVESENEVTKGTFHQSEKERSWGQIRVEEKKNWPFLSYIIVARNYDTHETYCAYECENCP